MTGIRTHFEIPDSFDMNCGITIQTEREACDWLIWSGKSRKMSVRVQANPTTSLEQEKTGGEQEENPTQYLSKLPASVGLLPKLLEKMLINHLGMSAHQIACTTNIQGGL